MSGKYSDNICEKLHEATLDGGADDEFGSCTEAPCQWWGLLLGSGVKGAQNAIVTEDSQGFVDYEPFPSRKQARAAFDRIVAEVTAEMHEHHEDYADAECELCIEEAEAQGDA